MPTGHGGMARIPKSLDLKELDQILPVLVDQGLPGHGEFLVADLEDDERTPAVIAIAVWHGYLPMAAMGHLLPKIHKSRCVLVPGAVHIGKKVRRKAKGFHLTINTAWAEVVQHVQAFTYTAFKGDCWLSDELARAYEAVSRVGNEWRRGSIAFHSVELWHTESGTLVAGEVGYTCGSVYSCTGFTIKDQYPGAGSVQLVALGLWLARCGFELWDLGMELDYKLMLGGQSVPRAEWARQIRTLRNASVVLKQPVGLEADAHALLVELAGGRGEPPEAKVQEEKAAGLAAAATRRSPKPPAELAAAVPASAVVPAVP